MKNIIKYSILLIFLGISHLGFSQKPLTHITIDPLKFNKQAFNVGLQMQMNELSQFALYSNFGQESGNITNDISTIQFQKTTQAFEARFFPFSQQKKCSLKGCEQANFGRNTNGINAPILRGVYLAPGILFEKITFDSLSQKKTETSTKSNTLTTKTRAFTLALGYQIQVSAFTLGVSYQVAFRKTAFDGSYDLLKDTDFFNQLQTNRTHLVNTLRAEIGIHF